MASLKSFTSVKHFIIVFTLLSFPLTLVHAQSSSEYGTPEERAAQMTSRMKEGLSLRQSQEENIYALNLKYARRIQQEVIDPDMNKLSAYFHIRDINKEKEKELFPLLDAPQKALYEEMKAEAVGELLSRFF